MGKVKRNLNSDKLFVSDNDDSFKSLTGKVKLKELDNGIIAIEKNEEFQITNG